MKILNLPIVILIFLQIYIPFNCFSQEIDWIFEVNDKVNTTNYGSFLLMLDRNGEFRRTTKINNCNAAIKLLPFGKNKLIASGHTCLDGIGTYRDTRLYNYQGKTLKTENNAFPGDYFSSLPIKEGFTFFSKPFDNFDFSYISIGTINKDLKIGYDSVSLKSIAKNNLGIVNVDTDPAFLSDETWIVPFQYGKIGHEGISMTMDHGSIIGIRDSKILWEYPKSLSNGKVEAICSYELNVAMLISQGLNYCLFSMVDQTGVELEKLTLNTQGAIIRDLLVTKKYIIVLGYNKILWYNKLGELIKEMDLLEMEISQANRSQLFGENSLICSAVKNGNAVIFKVIFEETSVSKYNFSDKKDDEEEMFAAEISYSSIDNEMDNLVVSASIYPNPTSSVINFEFEGKIDNEATFEVYIFNSAGKLMFSEIINNNSAQVDVQDLEAGIYIYQIRSNSKNNLITGQFVKVNR